MSGLASLEGQIKNSRSVVFRRCFIKRRLLGSGLFEDDWQDISQYVVKWGTITKEVDATKINSFKFSSLNMVFSNRDGKFNPSDDENSLWWQYGDQQRTLVRVEAGFSYQYQIDGIWRTQYLPEQGWDDAEWDVSTWDIDAQAPTVFNGFMSGDINLNGTDQVNIPILPLTEVFRQCSATRLSGYSDSLTASGFIEMLRDQVDPFGNFMFRPFFGDTTSSWVYQTTTVNYTNLDTTTAQDVINATALDIVETLAASENFVPFVTNDGAFHFTARDFANSQSSFHFVGAGGFSSQYGHTIKQVTKYGKAFSKYYSQVQIKFRNEDTTTSYVTKSATFRVSGDSVAWTLGDRVLTIENFWIPTSTVADVIAQELFDEYSALKTEIEFTTTFVPHLDLLQLVQITYDPTQPSAQGIWDMFNWGDDTDTINDDDLVWDSSKGDAIKLNAEEFRLISIALNLDSCECKFIGRQ